MARNTRRLEWMTRMIYRRKVVEAAEPISYELLLALKIAEEKLQGTGFDAAAIKGIVKEWLDKVLDVAIPLGEEPPDEV